MASATDRLDSVRDDLRMVHQYLADNDHAMAQVAISLAIRELAEINLTIAK